MNASMMVREDVQVAFRQICAEKAGGTGRITPVAGMSGWLFFRPELRHLSVGPFWGSAAARVSRASRPDWADPLPAILDFQAQMDRVGIAVLFVPVPPKAVVYPEPLSSKIRTGGRLDGYHQQFYTLLQKHGVRMLDLVPPLRAHRSDPEGPVYCRQDSHWSGRACVLAAQEIARSIRLQAWYTRQPKTRYVGEWKPFTLTGDLWRATAQATLARESLSLHFVGRRSGSGVLTPVAADPTSPVVLMGDSHNLIFHSGGEDMQTTGAGLADQLALELGFPVDVVGVRGSGATPARAALLRRARADTSYLKGKKLIIWCLSAREFTESTTGWQKVPVVR